MTRLNQGALALPVLLALTACSKQEATFEMDNSSEERSETPDVALTAAPGVAFRYVYRFALDAPKIATLQERHAAACEALGTDNCRITGLSYSRRGKTDVAGSLELALAPELARKFGKDAMAAVEAEKGVVSSVDIQSTDLKPALEDSADDAEAAQDERAALENASAGLSDARRRELIGRIAEQRRTEREAVARGAAIRKTLAITPLRLSYTTDGFLPGISINRTAWAALGFAALVLNALLALVVVLAALAIPGALILLGLAHGQKQAKRLWVWLAPSAAAREAS